MNKFGFIFDDADKMLNLAEDLEQVLNKYGLTLITYAPGNGEFEGNILAFIDVTEDVKYDLDS